jgi:hypothetical protein
LCDSGNGTQDIPRRQLLDHTGLINLKEIKTLENAEYGSLPNSPTSWMATKTQILKNQVNFNNNNRTMGPTVQLEICRECKKSEMKVS